MDITLIALFILALPVVFLVMPHWRHIISGVMILLVFEGALRKWVAPGFQAQIYILKDLLLMLAYTGFILNGPKYKLTLPVANMVKFFMLACVFYFALNITNPNNPSLILSLLGFKNYVLYFPLAFIVPYMVAEKYDLYGTLKLYMMIVFPAVIICYLQFVLPPTHWLNAYVSQSEGVKTTVSQFGGGIIAARTAGTFSYLSGNVTFLTAMFILSLSMLVGRSFSFKNNVFVYIMLAATMGAMFTTGSRFGVLSIILGAPLLMMIATMRGFVSAQFFIRFVVGSTALMAMMMFIAPDAISAFTDRATRVTDTYSRLLSPFTETIRAFESTSLFGTGLATTHGGMVTIVLWPGQSFYWLDGHFFEIELARVMQETGIIGFILFYGLRISATYVALKLAFKFQSRLHSALATGLALWFAIHIILFIAGNPPAALYFYFGLGLLFGMWVVERHHAQETFERHFGQRKLAQKSLATW